MSWRALPVLVAFLLAPAAVQAAGAPEAAGGCRAAAATPPCGYIQPFLDLNFPEKPSCGGSKPASACIPLPADGASLTMEGTLVYYWRLSEDGTYPPDMTQPIDITFKATAGDPKWLDFTVDPEGYTMQPQDLLDPRNTKTDDSTTPPTVLYWFERPVKVTFTRHGDPDAERVGHIAGRDGIEEVVVKVRATPNGNYFREGHGTETFRFDASSFVVPAPVTTSQQAPAWGLLGAVAALGLAARYGRRGAPAA